MELMLLQRLLPMGAIPQNTQHESIFWFVLNSDWFDSFQSNGLILNGYNCPYQFRHAMML